MPPHTKVGFSQLLQHASIDGNKIVLHTMPIKIGQQGTTKKEGRIYVIHSWDTFDFNVTNIRDPYLLSLSNIDDPFLDNHEHKQPLNHE